MRKLRLVETNYMLSLKTQRPWRLGTSIGFQYSLPGLKCPHFVFFTLALGQRAEKRSFHFLHSSTHWHPTCYVAINSPLSNIHPRLGVLDFKDSCARSELVRCRVCESYPCTHTIKKGRRLKYVQR